MTVLFVASLFMFMQVTVLAAPSNTVLVAEESFTGADDLWLKDYTGGTGFRNGWKASISADFETIAELPEDWKILDNQLTAQDAEYYLEYKTKVTNVGTNCSHAVALCTNDKSEYTFGYVNDNIYSGAWAFIGGNTPFGNKSSTSVLTNNTWYTFVVQISTRSGNVNDVVKIKAFKDGEDVTYTPDVWDLELKYNRAYIVNRIAITCPNGTGTGERPYFDEISIRKGSMIKAVQTTENAFNLFPGQIVTVSVPDTDLITGHAQTAVTEWYDCTDTTPVFLRTGNTFTCDISTVGRLIRAKTTVTDSIDSSVEVHYPVSKYIRDAADINRIRYVTSGSKLTVNVELQKSGPEHGTQGSFIPILAKYDAHNNLVETVTGNSVSYNGVWQNNTTSGSVAMDPCTLQDGEYVRVYVWSSIENVKPLSYNKNSFQITSIFTAN